MSARPERVSPEPGPPSVRVGVGYDVHRLVAGRRLVLGGLEIEHELGLEGHSDADVLAHAVTDAILGAAGLGDIGELFPDTEPEWEDADSLELLRIACARTPGRVVNVDATVICEAPPIGPHRGAIARCLAAVVDAPVNVKATTNEGLGSIGRGEGIAALAVALVAV
jgi:2-C-methyl-D-erythritol 2,4-cyclodiphosphate synthase